MQELFFQFDILWFFILISYSLFKILFFGKDAKNKSRNKVIQCQYLTLGTFKIFENNLALWKILWHEYRLKIFAFSGYSTTVGRISDPYEAEYMAGK